MATFYLVRHGQPDYSGLQERGMFGFGRDFAPLSPLGVQQAEETAKDPRLKQAERDCFVSLYQSTANGTDYFTADWYCSAGGTGPS